MANSNELIEEMKTLFTVLETEHNGTTKAAKGRARKAIFFVSREAQDWPELGLWQARCKLGAGLVQACCRLGGTHPLSENAFRKEKIKFWSLMPLALLMPP